MAGTFLFGTCLLSHAQTNPNPNAPRLNFALQWSVNLAERVKLFDSGFIKSDREQSLALLVDGFSPQDTKRTLLVARWNGSRFATEATAEFLGTPTDALLVAHFRTYTILLQGKEKTDSRKVTRNRQIVVSDSVFEWGDKDLQRIAPAPIGVKIAIEQGKNPAYMVAGSGDSAIHYAFEGGEIRRQNEFVPSTEPESFARIGVGMQVFPGSDALTLAPSVRYVQSYWRNRMRWLVGLAPGKLAPLPNLPYVTTGDRLVLYTPKFGAEEKSFWASGMRDMEEVWRSEPLPGRVLDVRVGDPKNEGKEGILVLIAENNDKDRRLLFFGRTGR